MPSEVSDTFAQLGKVPSETADGLPAFGGNEFGAQENSNREFCKAKLSKQGFALRRGNKFGTKDSSMRPVF